MAKLVYYDKENDILSVHKGFSNDEKFKGNIDVGGLVLDVSTKGRIKGIEIINACEFFNDFNIGHEVLIDIIDADFNASIKPSGIMIGIILKSKNIKQDIPAKIAVPLEIPTRHLARKKAKL